MLNKKNYYLFISLLMASSLSNNAFATNGYFMSGYSIKSQGMAGVSIALPQDALVSASNPAGIAFVGDRIDIGANYFKPNRGAIISGNGGNGNGNFDANGKSSFLIPDMGITNQVNSKIALGLSIYANGGMNTTYTSAISLFSGQNGSKAGVDLEQLFVAPTVAWKITPNESLGFSIIYAKQRFSATGLQNFNSANYSVTPGAVTDNGASTSTGYGIHIGWLNKFNDRFAVGIYYQSKINGNFDAYKGLFSGGGSFDIPANYGFGVTYRPINNFILGVDVQRIEYGNSSSVSNPLSNLTVNNNPLGSTSGPGFGWQSINVYKLGGAYEISNNLTVRSGFNYNQQPIPNNQTFFNILAPGTVQKELSLGFTYKLTARTELSGFYSHGFNQQINGSGSIPTGFGGGEASISLSEDYYGLSLGYQY